MSLLLAQDPDTSAPVAELDGIPVRVRRRKSGKGGKHRPAPAAQREAVEAALARLQGHAARPSQAKIAKLVGVSPQRLAGFKTEAVSPESLSGLLRKLEEMAVQWGV